MKESNNFLYQAYNFLEVRAADALHPGLTSWWRGIGAVILGMDSSYKIG